MSVQTDAFYRALDERYASVIVQRYVDLIGSGADVSVLRDGQTMTYDEVMAQNQT